MKRKSWVFWIGCFWVVVGGLMLFIGNRFLGGGLLATGVIMMSIAGPKYVDGMKRVWSRQLD